VIDGDELPRLIGRVAARACPPEVKTVAQWIEWRRGEDQRMLREMLEQITAHFEREAGATEH
jgi:hypothetical protein